ncbi:MAG: tetratricopeptide repeat protein [Deltaproteobacteria bacterium]
MKNLAIILAAVCIFCFASLSNSQNVKASEDMKLTDEGFQYMTKGNPAEAEKSFKKALSINPDNPYTLLNLGVLYQQTNRPGEARAMYEKVIKLQPQAAAPGTANSAIAGKGLAQLAADYMKTIQ